MRIARKTDVVLTMQATTKIIDTTVNPTWTFLVIAEQLELSTPDTHAVHFLDPRYQRS